MNIDKRQMEKISKMMGIHSESVDAEQVIIKTKDKEIIIDNPDITRLRVQNLDSFQISGKISERKRVLDEDVDLIVKQTSSSKEEAIKTLEETGDIAQAIIKLQKQT